MEILALIEPQEFIAFGGVQATIEEEARQHAEGLVTQAAGALVAITTVVLVIMYGQTRIFFAMCRDGLFPRRLAHVHPRFGTPARLTSASGS